jgi:SPW repeat-containing protein
MPTESEVHANASKLSAGINVILGIWLFVSPWVYGAAGNPNAWNSWIAGGLIVLFAWIRLAAPVGAAFVGWANVALAIWVFVSPWIYGYTGNTGRFINSLCVGVIVFLLSAYGASVSRHHLTGRPMQR